MSIDINPEDYIGLVRWHLNRPPLRSGWATSDDYDDDVQSGLVGVIEAARKWEPGKGSKFSAFASTNIVWAIDHDRRSRLGNSYRYAVNNRLPFDKPLSIDRPLGDRDGDRTIADLLADEAPRNDATSDRAAVLLPQVLALMSERDRLIALEPERAAVVLGIKPASVDRAYWRIVRRLKADLAA